jgi:hypothetical protein
MRPAIAERHAEALHRADRDIGAPVRRRFEQRQRQRIGDSDDQCAGFFRLGDCRGMVAIDA